MPPFGPRLENFKAPPVIASMHGLTLKLYWKEPDNPRLSDVLNQMSWRLLYNWRSEALNWDETIQRWARKPSTLAGFKVSVQIGDGYLCFKIEDNCEPIDPWQFNDLVKSFRSELARWHRSTHN